MGESDQRRDLPREAARSLRGETLDAERIEKEAEALELRTGMTANTKQFDAIYTEVWDIREGSETYYRPAGCILTRFHEDGRHEAFGFGAARVG
jgi:hypothetical protein